jgi:hypothetical protein
MTRRSVVAILVAAAWGVLLAGDFPCTVEAAPRTKNVTGKLRSVQGNLLVIQKRGLVSDSTIEIEMDDATKKTGQVVPGMRVKVKYREEKDGRKVAVEIKAEPEAASKKAKEAARNTREP